jgi:hypothetical protein
MFTHLDCYPFLGACSFRARNLVINLLNLQVCNRLCDSPHPVLLPMSSSMDPLYLSYSMNCNLV